MVPTLFIIFVGRGRENAMLAITKHIFAIRCWGVLLLALALFICVPGARAQDEKGCEGIGYAKHPQSEYSTEKLKARLEKDSRDVDALIHTGLHLEEKEEFEQAHSLYESAIHSKPNCYLGYYFAGLVEDRISRRAAANAEANIGKALSLNPSLHEDGNVQSFMQRHARPTSGTSSSGPTIPIDTSHIMTGGNPFCIGLGIGLLLAVLVLYIAKSRRTALKGT
jgi:tetratricopeptide (TPR) repeat protein